VDGVRIGLLIGVLELIALAFPALADEPVAFDREIVPLFKRHCVKCHGPVKQEADLNLATPNGLIRGGKSGAAVVSHDAEASLILQRVIADEMPPEIPLSADEKALVKKWIQQGTPGLSRSARDDGDHWAFRPLSTSLRTVPDLNPSHQYQADTASLDRFLLADLARDGLSFLPEADRFTQIRRVSFDLLGLPPTPEAIDEFVNDVHPDAYSRMVDRYLASPHFGERLGKVWLDAGGYADSNGYFNADTDRPLAYRYRDYVIRSLNADKPFVEFIREQLAGDEMTDVVARMGESIVLPTNSKGDIDAAARVIECWEATHYLRNGQDGTGESDGNPDEVRVDRYTVIETAMQNISTAVLGLTIQCAKCHDHKFEPLTQRDYYSFQAVLIPAFPPDQWMKPNDRFVYASLQDELNSWQNRLTEAEATVTRLQAEVNTWAQANRPRGNVLFSDRFDDPPDSLGNRWSHTAPGDDMPGGTASVNVNSREAPGAIVVDGHLLLIEGGPDGDKWLSTKNAFDWTPNVVGGSIQATFDLIDHHIDNSPAAERIGYFIAIHDFHHNGPRAGGNILVDGHPSMGTGVFLGYPGASSNHVGTIGTTGYVPSRNYGVRITNVGEGKFKLEQLVDGLVDEPSIQLIEADLPDGGFGFEFCCGRSFIVDNVAIESFSPRDGMNPLAEFGKEIASRRQPLDQAIKTRDLLTKSKPGKLSWTTDILDQPPQVHILERGNYAVPGQPVEPAGFAILGKTTASLSPTTIRDSTSIAPKSTGRRLAFANWLTEPDSKPASLMARVQVNRIWQQTFGTGLVASTDNFGLSGSPPSHRELLDWGANEFVRSGWSSKHVYRLLLNSAAYRQSSQGAISIPTAGLDSPPSATDQDRRRQLDPDGRRLSRFPVRRLDAEAIRDMLLFASEDFDDRLYGPYIPTSRTANGETIVPEDKPGVLRRSIYLQQKRTQVHSLLQVFDAPSIVFNNTRRARSTMPLQSLSLLNSEFVVARARHLTERLNRDYVGDSERLYRAFLLATGRPPSAVEAEGVMQFIHEQQQEYQNQSDFAIRTWTDLCQMLLVENAAIYVD